jgi:G6PDH family F420-dependent oxidoreductase
MMPGRFFLGVGTGENLNEHVLGNRWPPYDIRSEMLEEAVDVIRVLLEGETESYWGAHYTVEDARLFTIPDEPLPIMLAASGPKAAELAGGIGDGLISTAPEKEIIQIFQTAGGKDKPCYGQLTVCWAETKDQAQQMAHEIWPNAGLTGQAGARRGRCGEGDLWA